jgi:predicted metal-dependent hydrolase
VEDLVRDQFLLGVRRFNERRFFEAHEVWEDLWKAAAGDSRTLYQGLIQAAAALHHATRGNHAGARSLWNKAKVKLELSPAEYEGVAIGQLLADLKLYFSFAQYESAPPSLRVVAR